MTYTFLNLCLIVKFPPLDDALGFLQVTSMSHNHPSGKDSMFLTCMIVSFIVHYEYFLQSEYPGIIESPLNIHNMCRSGFSDDLFIHKQLHTL